jgi:glycosyltransferase involved in cell wall biosynthesis
MERACAELIRQTRDRFAFVIVAAEADPALRDLAEGLVEVPVPRHPMPLRFAVFFVKGGWALRKVRADIVHTVGAIVPNRVDLASIHCCHTACREVPRPAGLPRPSLARRVSRALAKFQARAAERWCYRPGRLRAFAAVSEGVAEELNRHFPGLPVAVTANGVDVGQLGPSPATRQQVRRETSTGDQEVVALFVGGDWYHKGLDLAIGGLALAASSGAALRLWVVGAGDEAAFRRIARRAGVADRVAFFGFRHDTPRFYQAADLFVLPSAHETFSIVCFEAAACGLPLVIPRLHGAHELVGNDQGGLVVERTATSIGEALLRLAGDQVLRRRLGAEALRRVAGYSWQRSAASVAGVYDALLAPGTEPGRPSRNVTVDGRPASCAVPGRASGPRDERMRTET